MLALRPSNPQTPSLTYPSSFCLICIAFQHAYDVSPLHGVPLCIAFPQHPVTIASHAAGLRLSVIRQLPNRLVQRCQLAIWKQRTLHGLGAAPE